MDTEKLKKSLEGVTPEQFAKFVGQTVDRLEKAANFLKKAAGAVGKAMETHEKMGEHMDGIADHVANMKDCMGKAIATGKLGKAEDAGEAKDMTTHMAGIEEHHGKLEGLISTMEGHLDNAAGAIEDATGAADEENDKGLAAAERTEKMNNRRMALVQKQNARQIAAMQKNLEKTILAVQSSANENMNALVKALAGPVVPEHVAKSAPIPLRTVTLEKSADGQQGLPAAPRPGEPPVAKAAGIEIQATDEYGMPNPEYLKAVAAGQLGKDGGTAFTKAAKEVPFQVGDPFPKNDTNLFREVHGARA